MSEETIIVVVDDQGSHEFVINGSLMNNQLTNQDGEIVLELDNAQNYLSGDFVYGLTQQQLDLQGESYEDALKALNIHPLMTSIEEPPELKGRRIRTLGSLGHPPKYLPMKNEDDLDLLTSEFDFSSQENASCSSTKNYEASPFLLENKHCSIINHEGIGDVMHIKFDEDSLPPATIQVYCPTNIDLGNIESSSSSSSSSAKRKISTLSIDENLLFKKTKIEKNEFIQPFTNVMTIKNEKRSEEELLAVMPDEVSCTKENNSQDSDDEDIDTFVEQEQTQFQVSLSKKNENGHFQCINCDKLFKMKLSLDIHMMGCKNKETSQHKSSDEQTTPLYRNKPNDNVIKDKCAKMLPYQCSVCEKSFKLSMTFKLHELSHGKPNNPLPESNEVVSDHTQNTNQSSKIITDIHKKYTCPVCDFSCLHKKIIVLHAREVHNYEYVFTCHKCKFTGLLANDYSDHLGSEEHKANVLRYKQEKELVHRPIQCQTCDYHAKDRATLERHMYAHIKDTEYPCPFCSYRGKTDYYLKKHMATHNETKRFKCSLCDYQTKSPYGLTRHIKVKHVQKVDKYKCRGCERSFSEMCELRVHSLLVHSNDHSFFCRLCTFSTKDKKDYKDHLQEHYGLNTFHCNECDFTCRNMQLLQRHQLRRHTEIRLHKCNVCSKTFQEKSDLKRHIMIHSNNKPYKCNFCEYRCKFRNTLTLHMKVHSNIKSYSCPTCDYQTKYAQNLKKHFLVHDKEKNFKCSLCSFRASAKDRIDKHMHRIHKDLTSEQISVIND